MQDSKMCVRRIDFNCGKYYTYNIVNYAWIFWSSCVCTHYTYISNIQIVEGFCREPKCQKMQFRREAVPHWLLQMLKSMILNCFFFQIE